MRGEYVPDPVALPARILLADGTVLKGNLLVASTKSLAGSLNSAQPFLEFEAHGGERSYVAKAQITSVTPVTVPKVASLNVRASDNFEPCIILGISQKASRNEIREGYLLQVKKYHPDRFASLDLPDEVVAYLGAMLSRINAAYAMLESDQLEPV